MARLRRRCRRSSARCATRARSTASSSGGRIPARLLVAQPELRAALAAELAVLCSLAKLEPAQVRKGLWFQGFLGFRVVRGDPEPAESLGAFPCRLDKGFLQTRA